MPRKHPRPQARKRAAKRKTNATTKPERRVVVLTPPLTGLAMTALVAMKFGDRS